MDVIYCFWTGKNELTPNRQYCLDQLRNTSECNVVLVTRENLHEYILPDHPLHPSYAFLSETHKADYLRTYFMHFYGGGYSDIKQTTGSWKDSFHQLKHGPYWICGYAEIPTGVAYEPYADKWNDLIGNCAYICKPYTPLTTEWYHAMLAFLDTKLDELIQHPATHPQDQKCPDSRYPIEWNEMLGRIFHRISYHYKDYLLRTLPICVFYNYR